MTIALDPILQQLMVVSSDDTPSQGFADMDPVTARAFTREMIAALEATITPVGSATDTELRTSRGVIKLRIYTPNGAEPITPAIVTYHGGGWVVGDLDTHDNTARILADRTGARVISVDYRLAPEHPFPAAPEDAYAALLWVHDQGERIGIDPDRIGVAGDSAGGNIAAAVAIMARDRNGPELRIQILAYPSLEYKSDTASMEKMAKGYGLEKRDMHWFFDHYVGDDADKADPRLSPLLVDDLSGIAPAVISVAGFDPLHDDGMRYADRLNKAGVNVSFFDRTSLVHGFLSMTKIVPAADEAFNEISTAAKAALFL